MSEFPKANDKPAWRNWAKTKRKAVDTALLAPQILSRLTELPEWNAAKHILLYLSFAGELPVELLGSDTTKRFYLPRCAPKRQLTIHFFIPDVTPLVSSAFGLREPDPTFAPAVPAKTIDLVIVPALLFSENGRRLGYGGGYYDRFLKCVRPDCVTVGAIADRLLVPTLPAEPHDIPVQIVVSETRTLRLADTKEPIPRPYSG